MATQQINGKFISGHTLQECLEAFTGASGNNKQERMNSLNEPFKLLAQKMLYGGHFEVKNNKGIVRKVYLHTIEFYYHEEAAIIDSSKIDDYIVYHRNPFPTSQNSVLRPIPPFKIGSLNTHISGVDITFEDQSSEPKYRASILVRALQVIKGNGTAFMIINEKDKDKYVEHRSTYLYNYLFMDSTVSGNQLTISWEEEKNEDVRKHGSPKIGLRLNVWDYEPKVRKVIDGHYVLPQKQNGKNNTKAIPDNKPWAFSVEEFPKKLQYKPEPTTIR